MIAQTDAGTWAVPTGHALLLPPGLMHDITMHGAVRMLTAYIAQPAWRRAEATKHLLYAAQQAFALRRFPHRPELPLGR